jgi:MFS family permease
MMLGLASSLTALFGYAFYQIPNDADSAAGLRGWQWMMLLIAMISAISTVVTYFFLPDSPTRAKFLTEEEKTLFVERVRRNDQGIRQKEWRAEQAWEAAGDPLAYMLFFLAISQTMVSAIPVSELALRAGTDG